MSSTVATRTAGPARPGDAGRFPAAWSLGASDWILVGLLAVAFVALFFRWFHLQHEQSQKWMADWGHAYFVPLISGYLIWLRRAELARARAEPFWPGLAPLALGIACYMYAAVALKNAMLQGYCVILALGGLALLVLGPRVFRYVFLPICFLGFGVTVSRLLMSAITAPLQVIASNGSYVLLNLIGAVAGFSTEVEGVTLQVITSDGAVHDLNVAEACSGLRMVVGFAALAAATALIGCRRWWQRTALALLAVPVAIFLNVIRVTVLGLLTMVDSSLASGEAHTLIGTLLLIPGLGLFMLIVWALNKLVTDAPPARAAGGVA